MAAREALLDAAERVVRDHGAEASMAVVAAEAGITKPILYRHFGDKQGLLAALAHRQTTRIGDAVEAALAVPGTARERVARAVDAYLAAVERDPQTYRFLLRSPEAAEAQPQVRSSARALGDRLATATAPTLGLPAGSLRAQAWAHAAVGTVQAVGDWWLDARPCPRAEVVDEVVTLLLDGWRGAGLP